MYERQEVLKHIGKQGQERLKKSTVAIGFFDTNDLASHNIKCLIPADTLELPLTSYAYAFHWMLETVGVILAAKIG